MGWWKFLGPNAQTRWDSITIKGQELTMLNNPLINFHFHYFRDSAHAFDQAALKECVKDIFNKRRKKGDDLIFYEIHRLEGNH